SNPGNPILNLDEYPSAVTYVIPPALMKFASSFASELVSLWLESPAKKTSTFLCPPETRDPGVIELTNGFKSTLQATFPFGPKLFGSRSSSRKGETGSSS